MVSCFPRLSRHKATWKLCDYLGWSFCAQFSECGVAVIHVCSPVAHRACGVRKRYYTHHTHPLPTLQNDVAFCQESFSVQHKSLTPFSCPTESKLCQTRGCHMLSEELCASMAERTSGTLGTGQGIRIRLILSLFPEPNPTGWPPEQTGAGKGRRHMPYAEAGNPVCRARAIACVLMGLGTSVHDKTQREADA